MSETNYQDEIKYYQIRLTVVLLLVAGLMGLEAVLAWRWYQNEKQAAKPQETMSQFQRQEFNGLWQRLKEKTIEVDINQGISYGSQVGRLEPFD
ncbi:hypothetical protein A3B59_00170 [Candidatus Beckwithbacteria bacterium RIFCSPLOWO2_01_FULL_49_47]|nr:MAG: hypothetical protein A3B59_00170 [Candidatus Beckwithbacteria bacterium RIFCSPLOWO2_01_FULL_49_47]OGD65237.1 MAG: hypothetical protein A2584_03010 [Candidatus Beckwithbacteria bacterium RIFOXYD1_FULL_50_11]HBU22159.1 hypothetical protein [Candidatus Beckwithbacteria bacterium]